MLVTAAVPDDVPDALAGVGWTWWMGRCCPVPPDKPVDREPPAPDDPGKPGESTEPDECDPPTRVMRTRDTRTRGTTPVWTWRAASLAHSAAQDSPRRSLPCMSPRSPAGAWIRRPPARTPTNVTPRCWATIRPAGRRPGVGDRRPGARCLLALGPAGRPRGRAALHCRVVTRGRQASGPPTRRPGPPRCSCSPRLSCVGSTRSLGTARCGSSTCEVRRAPPGRRVCGRSATVAVRVTPTGEPSRAGADSESPSGSTSGGHLGGPLVRLRTDLWAAGRYRD